VVIGLPFNIQRQQNHLFTLTPFFLIVTDNGWTLYEIRALGIVRERPGQTISPIAESKGITYEKGEIYLENVLTQALSTAIIFVANASKEAVEAIIREYEYPDLERFKSTFNTYIKGKFGDKFKKDRVFGASERTWNFDYVYYKSPEHILITDPLWPNADYLSRKLIMHRDVAKRQDPKVEQYLVYNESDSWPKEDRALLEIVTELSIPVVSFSKAQEELTKKVNASIRL
jgi:hypothetical protein